MEYNDVVPLYAEKFRRHVDSPDSNGCRRWTGFCDDDGYGHFQFRHEGRKYKIRAHRAAVMVSGAHVMPEAVLRHSCDNPWCAEASHVLQGGHADNVADRDRRGHTAIGADNGRARMTDDDVMSIRGAAAAFIKQQAVGLGVDEAAVRAALAQKTWRHVGGSEETVVDFDDQESAVLRIMMDTLFLLPPRSRRKVATAFAEMAPDLVGEVAAETPSPKVPKKAADPKK